MSLFRKYEDNKGESQVEESFLPRNTLFNDTGLSQTSPSQNVVLGRANSNLFRSRQEQDEERINNFLDSAGGRIHIDKERRLSQSNPIFSPGDLRDNPTRSILPRKVATNSGLAGSGIFNDKFGLTNISQNEGYSKYFKSEDSKLKYLYNNFTNNKINPESRIPQEESSATNNAVTGFLDTVAGFTQELSSGVSELLGFKGPTKDELYSYNGGPGADKGIGLTTVYRYDPLANTPFKYKDNFKVKSSISGYYNTDPSNFSEMERRPLHNKVPTGFKSIQNNTITDRNNKWDLLSLSEADIDSNLEKDLIDFKLEIIDLEEGTKSYYLYFKAFIDNFSDNFKPNYDTLQYPGNPTGKIFKYQDFSRSLSVNFKVAIFSEKERDNVYKKLNRLASTTLPTFTEEAVRSTITKLTVGNWCKRLPGVVDSISFPNLVEYPWDIDSETPMIVNINMEYKYSSTYGDQDIIIGSSPAIETKLFGQDVPFFAFSPDLFNETTFTSDTLT
jgi:hypothetical protein